MEIELIKLNGDAEGVKRELGCGTVACARSREEITTRMGELGLEYKEGDEDRIFRFVASTETVDSYGDIIRVGGWDTNRFSHNPVMPWCHDYCQPPIGLALFAWIDKGFTLPGFSFKGALLVDMIFATEDLNPFAAMIEGLVRAKFLRTVSVGFLPREYRWVNDIKEMEAIGMVKPAFEFKTQELLEISPCTVPANPDALLLAMKAKGLDQKLVRDLFGVTNERLERVRAGASDVAVLGYEARKIDDIEALWYYLRYAKEINEPLDVINLDVKARLFALGLNVGATKAEIEDLAKSIGLMKAAPSLVVPRRLTIDPQPETKAGAVLSKRNKERIAQARALLQEVLDDATPVDDDSGEKNLGGVEPTKQAVEQNDADDFSASLAEALKL